MLIQLIDPRLKMENFKPATQGSAGIDMFACIPETITLASQEQVMLGTGIKVAIPYGWVGMLYPRSGLGNKGLILSHTVGVIDSDYRGEIKLPLYNRNSMGKPLVIEPLHRVAQLVIIPHYQHNFISVSMNELPGSERGDNGFGSTGN